jgi:hypothetical protein
MYTFQIDIGSYSNPVIGGGYVVCHPILESAKLKKYRDENYRRVIRQKIEGQLKFFDDIQGIKHTNYEYTALRTLYDNNELYVPIKVYYNDVLKLTGRLDLLGQWDLNKHLCGLNITTEDSYSEIFKYLDSEIDILNVAAKTVKTDVTSDVYTHVADPTPLPVKDFKPILFGEEDQDYFLLTDTQVVPGEVTNYIYTFKSSTLYFEAAGYKYSTFNYKCNKPIATSEVVRDSFTRFRLMYDVLVYIFDYLNLPITVNPSTYCPYFDEDTEMKYLFIADKSDIKRHTDSNGANYEYVKVGEFFNLYKILSNLDWYIEDGEFKLEHQSSVDLADLSLLPKHDFTANGFHVNLQRYEHDQQKKVYKELWQFEDAGYIDYRKQEIIYDNFETAKKENTRSDLNTDFEWVTCGLSDVSDSGICVVAAELVSGTYYIINKNGLVQPRSHVNGKLAITNIIQDHFITTGRPYVKGTFLGSEIDLGVDNLRMIEYNNVPIFDPDLLDFDYAINTEMGMAIADELEIDLSLVKASRFKGRLIVIEIKTRDVINITNNEATSGGIIGEFTGLTIIQKGVCWSINNNPTLADSHTENGSGINSFYSLMTGLTENTVYYVRSYITTDTTTIYGNQVSFTTLETPDYGITVQSVDAIVNIARFIVIVSSLSDPFILRCTLNDGATFVVDTNITTPDTYTINVTSNKKIGSSATWIVSYIVDGKVTKVQSGVIPYLYVE